MHPSQVTLEPDEVRRVNRARLAFLLHKLPAEIDAAPASDIEELIGVHNIDEEMAAWKAKTNG